MSSDKYKFYIVATLKIKISFTRARREIVPFVFILVVSHNKILDIIYCNVGHIVKPFLSSEGHRRILIKVIYKFCVAATFKARDSL